MSGTPAQTRAKGKPFHFAESRKESHCKTRLELATPTFTSNVDSLSFWGKVALYQLSYFRICFTNSAHFWLRSLHESKLPNLGSPANYRGQKLAFARRQILQQSSTLIVHLYFSSTLSFCTFLKKYQKQGSRVRHSVLPLFKSCFATSFSRFTPRRSLLVAMLGAARTRCAQTSCHLFPSIARLLTVPPNAAH